jgi:hypothetical protein
MPLLMEMNMDTDLILQSLMNAGLSIKTMGILGIDYCKNA